MSVPVPYQDSTYDKRPSIPVAGRHAGFRGEPAWERLAAAIAGSRVTVIDCYPGVDVTAVIDRVRREAFMTGPSRHRTGGRRTAPP